MVGTFLLIYTVGATALGLQNSGQSVYAQTLYASLVNFVGLSLFILSAAPASGGHLKYCFRIAVIQFADVFTSPTISISTFFAGLSTLSRRVLYITAHITGAVIGCFYLKVGVGAENFFPSVSPKFVVRETRH